MPSLYRNEPTFLGVETIIGSGTTGIVTGTPVFYDQLLSIGAKGHSGYPDLLGGGRDVGGEFALSGRRFISTLVPAAIRTTSNAHNRSYSGMLYASPAGAALSKAQNNDSEPGPFGATAYSKMKPAQPQFNALNAIFELKDIPGMLRQRFHKNGLKNLGSYYLALKFGWEPLLRDVRNFVLTQREAQDILKQLLRDNGRPVRRRINLRDDRVVDSVGPHTGYPTWFPILNTYYYQKPPAGIVQFGTSDRVWASAQFRYWLPPGPRDIAWKRRMIAAIFGLNPSPSMVYNAIPWSWLVDWFSNVGDVVNNLDAGVADRLAADYFYVMRERGAFSEVSSTNYLFDMNRKPISISGTSSCYAFKKRRVKGDPFGFATPQNTLSGMQLSILGALGLSRLR